MNVAIVLASGLSTRMGESKLLLPFKGTTLGRHTVCRVREVFGRVVVVAGAACADDLSGVDGVEVVMNEAPEAGQASSLALGVAHARRLWPNADGALVFLGDEPRFDAGLARRVDTCMEDHPGAIVAPRFHGGICHPVGFSSSWFDELAGLAGDAGARQLIGEHEAAVRHLDAFAPSTDVDTPQDYLKAVVGGRPLVVVRGAGDLATGSICRLHEAGFPVVALEVPWPTVIRRTVAFANALIDEGAMVEGLHAVRCDGVLDIAKALACGQIPVCEDPHATLAAKLGPAVVVDAILAKRNLGTTRDMADVVVALGPGFVAGKDCDAVVETQRGHNLGRVIYRGSAAPDTGRPGNIGGYTAERVIHAPAAGTVKVVRDIGSSVTKGECIAFVDDTKVTATIDGTLRGMITPGTEVPKGMKMADIDPRDVHDHCFSISDKARAVGGGTLEAVMHLLQRDQLRLAS